MPLANLYAKDCTVLGVHNLASEETMPISDVKHRGVDFDHASVAGESLAEAPARSSTCGAFLVMPSSFAGPIISTRIHSSGLPAPGVTMQKSFVRGKGC